MPNYKINQKNDDKLLIVEIIESGYDYNDFVLFYFSKDIANDKILIEKIATKIDEYRKQDSVCIFGACKDSGDNDFSLIQNKFDLFFTNTTEQLFEDLINACYGTRSGMIHADPEEKIAELEQKQNYKILAEYYYGRNKKRYFHFVKKLAQHNKRYKRELCKLYYDKEKIALSRKI